MLFQDRFEAGRFLAAKLREEVTFGMTTSIDAAAAEHFAHALRIAKQSTAFFSNRFVTPSC
jgi:hypothetical protein